MTENKTMAEIRDAEAEKYAKEQFKLSGKNSEIYNDFEYPVRKRAFKAGFDCRDRLDNEALNLLIGQIQTVKSTGPNQEEVLKKLYEIVDNVLETRGKK